MTGPGQETATAPVATELGNPIAIAADAVAIVVFVLLGRRAHDEGGWFGMAGVAAPFLAGAVVGWVGLLLVHRPLGRLRSGLVVLAATVAIGMTLRHLAGGGVPPAFVAVATTFLAVFLLGWRAVVQRVRG